MKRKVISPPPSLEKVEEENLANIEGWKKYFSGLSDRIVIKAPSAEELAEMKKQTIEFMRIDGELVGWPDREQLVFAVSINSALPGLKPEYLFGDTYLFCYGDIAFSLTHFEWDGEPEEDPVCIDYSLRNYEPELLSWEFMANLIKATLVRLVEGKLVIKKAPKNP